MPTKFALLVLLIVTSSVCVEAMFTGRHLLRTRPMRSLTRMSTLKDIDSHVVANNKPLFDDEGNTKYFEYDNLECKIYKWWEESGYFKPSADEKKKPYVLPMPPPNVTGYLHMGHALFVALQDIMARFHRMRGKSTLWLPGTDHAGIATQLLVERSLNEQGIKRQDIGREAFLEKVWSWKEEKGGYITKQMRRLGASADWSRERFTLEEDMTKAVVEAFVRLHEKGLVYRGDYLVNWSPNLQTAVSDLEVDYVEEEGKLYTFKYELADGSGFIPVATTRPETIIGDTAVCVHPNDARYAAFVGKTVKVPMSDREVPVITDEYVDMEFGTGALKITPAHDVNDYELGKKHSLPQINIMNKDASINELGGERYAGLDRFECRAKIWEDMGAAGLVIKEEPHMQRVPRSQRGGEVIEPLVSSQWFVKMDNMGARAAQSVRDKDVRIFPDRFEKVWYNWLDNIRDWCVSRQLWWGHRVPAYYVNGSNKDYVIARSLEEARVKAEEQYGPGVSLEQDEDVLDTWFSSGLWPFATVGWPFAEGDAAAQAQLKAIDAADYSRFYPAAVLETGYDILFFWVARMVMMGLEFTDKAPFHTIYLHGLVRDGQGQKMSKTKGNVIDPIETIDKFGCDALRFSLVTGSTPGQDVPLSMEKIESNRNFVNKLWNVGKYVQNVLSALSPADAAKLAVTKSISAEELQAYPLAERFIVSECHAMVQAATKALEAYNFGEAAKLMYEFLWDELADWYVEASKTKQRDPDAAEQMRRVLVYVWDVSLRSLHPYMPYITETLWQLLPHAGESIMMADWPELEEDPQALHVDEEARRTFRSIQALTRAIRNARAEYATEPGKKLAAVLVVAEGASGEALVAGLQSEKPAVSLLARLEESSVQIVTSSSIMDYQPPEALGACVNMVVEDGLSAYVPLSDMVDYEKEKQRLSKQIEKLNKDVTSLESRVNSKGFVEKAPPAKVQEVREQLQEKKDQLASVSKNLADLVAAQG